MKNMFLIIPILLTICSCSENDKDKDFDIIYNGVLNGNGEEGITQSNMVVDNTTDWESLMFQMNSVNNVTDSFFETDLDFDTYLVIAVFLEVKPSGWEVQINSITENENSLFVSTNENQFDSSVITQPFSIVKIPKTEKQIVFNLELTE